MICIALLCCRASVHIWSASSYYEDLNCSEAGGSYKNVVYAGQDHCVGEGDGDGGGGGREAV